MIRRMLVLGAILGIVALACKNTDGAAGADGAVKGPKLICKMNNQCWICPDEAAMKKCIINPATSGCKQGSPGECS